MCNHIKKLNIIKDTAKKTLKNPLKSTKLSTSNRQCTWRFLILLFSCFKRWILNRQMSPNVSVFILALKSCGLFWVTKYLKQLSLTTCSRRWWFWGVRCLIFLSRSPRPYLLVLLLDKRCLDPSDENKKLVSF